MNLYLVRHGAAADVAITDADRALTDLGQQEAHIAGKALARMPAPPRVVLASPLLRARQTAEIIAGELAATEPVAVLDELANGHSTATLLRALKPWSQAAALVLVGHMPGVADHLGMLIGAGHHGQFHFSTGTVACVKLADWRTGGGELRWLMRQEQLALVS